MSSTMKVAIYFTALVLFTQSTSGDGGGTSSDQAPPSFIEQWISRTEASVLAAGGPQLETALSGLPSLKEKLIQVAGSQSMLAMYFGGGANQEAAVKATSASDLASFLAFLIHPVTHGFRVSPELFIKDAVHERDILLYQTQGDVEKSLRRITSTKMLGEAAVKILMTELPDLQGQEHLVQPLWNVLRSATLAAALHGHDVKTEAVQVRILKSIVRSFSPSVSGSTVFDTVIHIGEALIARAAGPYATALAPMSGLPAAIVIETLVSLDRPLQLSEAFIDGAASIPKSQWEDNKAAAMGALASEVGRVMDSAKQSLGALKNMWTLGGGEEDANPTAHAQKKLNPLGGLKSLFGGKKTTPSSAARLITEYEKKSQEEKAAIFEEVNAAHDKNEL